MKYLEQPFKRMIAFLYTGISKDVFQNLSKAITVEGPKKFFNICIDQLLMTLMRLRLGLLYGHLAGIFHKPLASVDSIMKHTLYALGKIMKKVVLWLPRNVIETACQLPF